MTNKKFSTDREAMLAKRKQILKQALERAKTAKITEYPDNKVRKGEIAPVGDWSARETYYREARRMGYYSETERGFGSGVSDYRRTLKDYGF